MKKNYVAAIALILITCFLTGGFVFGAVAKPNPKVKRYVERIKRPKRRKKKAPTPVSSKEMEILKKYGKKTSTPEVTYSPEPAPTFSPPPPPSQSPTKTKEPPPEPPKPKPNILKIVLIVLGVVAGIAGILYVLIVVLRKKQDEEGRNF